MLAPNNTAINQRIDQENQLMRELVNLFQQKTLFINWPSRVYAIFWQALQPCDNAIECQKSDNLIRHLGLMESPLPVPLAFDQTLEFVCAVERVRADLARLVRFRSGRDLLQSNV